MNVDTSRRPFVFVWELTRACELACKHCRADAQSDRHPAELTTAEGKQLLEDVRTFGEDQLVVLSGGDPMARPDTVELVRYGVDRGLQMTITPSGTSSLTPSTIGALADAGTRRVALSIDGATATAHDTFRGEAGSFAETLRAARTVRDEGLPLQINTTVCQETVAHLPKIRELVSDLGATMWAVFFLVPVGRGVVLESISPQRVEAVLGWLAEISAEGDFAVKTTEAPQYRRVLIDHYRRTVQEAEGRPDAASPEPPRGAGIIAGDGFVFVSHIGDVYPSGFLPLSGGNVREKHVVDIYRDADLFASLRDRDNLHGKCGACSYRHVCGGSRSRAYACTGDPFASDPLCAHVPEGYDGPLPASPSPGQSG